MTNLLYADTAFTLTGYVQSAVSFEAWVNPFREINMRISL